MKFRLAFVVLVAMVAACNGDDRDQAATTPISLEDLQHHRWVLVGINGLNLKDYAIELGFDADSLAGKIPVLDFGEKGNLSGNTGCNNFNTKASVADSSLTMSLLASTRMACVGFAGELELQLNMIYSNSLEISMEGNLLILKSGDKTLNFELRDWFSSDL